MIASWITITDGLRVVHLAILGAGWRLCDESVGPLIARPRADWLIALLSYEKYEAPTTCTTCLWCMSLWLRLCGAMTGSALRK